VARIVPEFAPDSLTDELYVMGNPTMRRWYSRPGGIVWPCPRRQWPLLNWPDTAGHCGRTRRSALAEQLSSATSRCSKVRSAVCWRFSRPGTCAIRLAELQRHQNLEAFVVGLSSLVRAPRCAPPVSRCWPCWRSPRRVNAWPGRNKPGSTQNGRHSRRADQHLSNVRVVWMRRCRWPRSGCAATEQRRCDRARHGNDAGYFGPQPPSKQHLMLLNL